MRRALHKSFVGIAFVAIITIAPAFAGGGKEAAVASPQTVRLTYVKSPLNVPAILDAQLGLFDRALEGRGIGVERFEITAGPRQTEAMAAGSIDIATVLGGASAILAAANGNDLRIVGVFSRAPEAFRIMTGPDGPAGIRDLRGRKVGGPKGTVLHQLLLAALAREGLAETDLDFVSMDIPVATAALVNRNIDAALAAGPAALAAERNGARVLTTGKGLVSGLIVVAVRGEFLRRHPDLVRIYLETQREAFRMMQTDLDQAVRVTAAETGLSADDVRLMLPWYDFEPVMRASDREELERTQDFLVRAGLVSRPIRIADLVHLP